MVNYCGFKKRCWLPNSAYSFILSIHKRILQLVYHLNRSLPRPRTEIRESKCGCDRIRAFAVCVTVACPLKALQSGLGSELSFVINCTMTNDSLRVLHLDRIHVIMSYNEGPMPQTTPFVVTLLFLVLFFHCLFS